MKTKTLTKTVRVLFAIHVEVPLDHPNTMKKGPGPDLFNIIESAADCVLGDAEDFINHSIVWRDEIGKLKLFAVEESDPTVSKGAWRRVGWDKTL